MSNQRSETTIWAVIAALIIAIGAPVAIYKFGQMVFHENPPPLELKPDPPPVISQAGSLFI